MNNINIINNVYVINLKHRVDRLENATKQFNKLNITFNRFEAITHDKGNIGCAMSHKKCVELAIENNLEYCIICEDDLYFTIDEKLFNNYLTTFLNDNKLDVLILLGFVRDDSTKEYNDLFNTTNNTQCATCYCVKKHYYQKILDNFTECVNNKKFVSLDQYWKKLQKDDCWVVPKKFIGGQIESYSDIEKKKKSYERFFIQNKTGGGN